MGLFIKYKLKGIKEKDVDSSVSTAVCRRGNIFFTNCK